MKLLPLLLILASYSQAQNIRWGGTTGDVTSTGLVATIQQPSSGAKLVTLETAVVYCAVACTVLQAQNGTAATATAGTLTAITNTSGSIVTKFFTASNVGGGTSVPGIFRLTAGQTAVIDLSKVSLPATSSTALNYSITLSGSSGTMNITFYGSER